MIKITPWSEFLREEKRKDINKLEDIIYQEYYEKCLCIDSHIIKLQKEFEKEENVILKMYTLPELEKRKKETSEIE